MYVLKEKTYCSVRTRKSNVLLTAPHVVIKREAVVKLKCFKLL